jgi:hypothetical protein
MSGITSLMGKKITFTYFYFLITDRFPIAVKTIKTFFDHFSCGILTDESCPAKAAHDRLFRMRDFLQ